MKLREVGPRDILMRKHARRSLRLLFSLSWTLAQTEKKDGQGVAAARTKRLSQHVDELLVVPVIAEGTR